MRDATLGRGARFRSTNTSLGGIWGDGGRRAGASDARGFPKHSDPKEELMRKEGNGSGRTGSSEGMAGLDGNMFAPFAAPGMEAMIRAGNVWMKGVGSLNEEVLSFSQEQLGKYMNAGQSLLHCSSIEQAMSTQYDLARNALESYSREANKLLSLTAEIAREAWTPVETRAAGGGN
jgi:hypothetical protein